MIRALLAGRKTQTRRVIKPQTENRPSWNEDTQDWGELWYSLDHHRDPTIENWRRIPCSYGIPGDRLWVRETFLGHLGPPPIGDGAPIPERSVEWDGADVHLYYRSTFGDDPPLAHLRWKPSIHMPRWASRILLEVTDVRVQRVQDISEEDALAEGVDVSPLTHEDMDEMPEGIVRDVAWALGVGARPSGRFAFQCLWDDLNEKRGFGWHCNPWVWVVTFRRIQP